MALASQPTRIHTPSEAPPSRGPASLVPSSRRKRNRRDAAAVGLPAHYELREHIGEGGMGTVWRARDRTLDVDVAIKLIRSDSTSPDAYLRLLFEARAAARIEHPSIVRVLSSGVTNEGRPYVVMEMLDGESLDTVIKRRGKMPAVEAIRLLLPLVGAVAHAHDLGVVHRDIKPSNVFLHRERGGRMRPKLLDFGIAKSTLGEDVSVTVTGAVMGTPAYMSPEQACGLRDVDARADVWALATVLYEVLTGRAAFRGNNYNAVLSAVLTSSPTPLRDLVTIDVRLARIIERGLCRNRDERWSSARSFGKALAGWLLSAGYEHDVTHSMIRASSLCPPAAWTGSLPPADPREEAARITGRITGRITDRLGVPSWLANPRVHPLRRARTAAAAVLFFAMAVSAAAGDATSQHALAGALPSATVPVAPPAKRQPAPTPSVSAAPSASAPAAPPPVIAAARPRKKPEPVKVEPAPKAGRSMPLPTAPAF
jgi:serine/threonine-protein kinase